MLSPSDKILANLILQLLWSYLDCDFCGAAAPLASGLAWNFQISKSDDNAFANLCWEVHECLVYKDITYQLPSCDLAFPKTISISSPPLPLLTRVCDIEQGRDWWPFTFPKEILCRRKYRGHILIHPDIPEDWMKKVWETDKRWVVRKWQTRDGWEMDKRWKWETENRGKRGGWETDERQTKYLWETG